VASPVGAFPVGQDQDDVLTAPLDIPSVVDPAPEREISERDAPPPRASSDIPRADALDDE